ncbi:hypothetical protein [Algoriphagus sp.]|uniref:hypothetical protein n=1 Tax=Algoriphagus sp. TaxID=1872435 RepID=UPI00260278F9|nr:hypothetical protein [Algoriphagus sp.]
MNKLITPIILAILITFSSCKDQEDTNPISSDQISFEVSGAISGEKTGSSYVVVVEGSNSYVISSNDGTSFDDQTFSLSFYKSFADQDLSNPAPGTYPIGTVADVLNVDGFWVVYTDTQSGKEYGARNVDGTLTITSSSNNQLAGTFEFSAGSFNEGDGNIQISQGTFSASVD